MSDIIREVDEELRHERYKRLWDRYGAYVVGAALLLVLGVAGWRGYEWYQAREAQKASARFDAALQLATDGKRAEAEAAFNEIAKDGTYGYRVLARFRAATEAGRGDVKAGIAAFDAIAADTSIESVMRDIARVHSGYLLVDTATVPELTERLKTLMDPSSPFRHSANEILGLAHYRAGELNAAQKIFSGLISDAEAPPSMRQRMQVMYALVAGQTAGAKPAAPAAPSATQ